MKQNWLDSLGFNREWLYKLPKTISSNGCWIQETGTTTDKGYKRLQVNNFRFTLSRIVVCITYNLDYYDSLFECRHGLGCDRSCFNPEHLSFGTHADNIRDTVEHKTHHNSAKDVCPKCGGRYHLVRASKHGKRITRRCRKCYNENKRAWRAKNK